MMDHWMDKDHARRRARRRRCHLIAAFASAQTCWLLYDMLAVQLFAFAILYWVNLEFLVGVSE